jgi:hypothetical protein
LRGLARHASSWSEGGCARAIPSGDVVMRAAKYDGQAGLSGEPRGYLDHNKRSFWLPTRCSMSARYIGNARCTRTIYESARRGELPIFKLNNRLAAYADALDDVMREKERAALDAYDRRRRVLVAGGRR